MLQRKSQTCSSAPEVHVSGARKILIVSYAYPHATAGWGGTVGGERMRQFAKHLPAHGIEPCLLTHRGRERVESAPPELHAAVDIMRWLAELVEREPKPAHGAPHELRTATRAAQNGPRTDAPAEDPKPSNLHAARSKSQPNAPHPIAHAQHSVRSTNERVAHTAPRGDTPVQPRPETSAPREGWRLNQLRARARRWMLPDRASFAWAPLAFAAGVRLFQRERPRLVLSSSPPMAAHVVACALAARFGVPWIADVRDGYSFEPPEGHTPLPAARRAVERFLYARAARVVTVSDALRDDFRSFLPLAAADVFTLCNGFDSEIFPEESPPALDAGAFTILYAGSTSFGAGRDLASLLRGVDRFAAQAHIPVRARLMGLFAAEEIPTLLHAELDLTGWRPRTEVVQSMQQADALVVLTGNHKSVATTKLFEYIGAGRPILVVGRDSAAARIVREHELGVVSDDDPDSIAGALHSLERERETWARRLSADSAREVRRKFSRQGQAAVLAQHIHALIDAP